MRDVIKEWTEYGIDYVAFTESDLTADHPRENQTAPDASEGPEVLEQFEQYLERYDAGEWHYIGVVVEASIFEVELASDSVWGIESDAVDYHRTVADELFSEVRVEALEELERRAKRGPAPNPRLEGLSGPLRAHPADVGAPEAVQNGAGIYNADEYAARQRGLESFRS
jgi:hypothetical protein